MTVTRIPLERVEKLWDYLQSQELLQRDEVKALLDCTDEELAETVAFLLRFLEDQEAEKRAERRRLSIPISRRRPSKMVRNMLAHG